MKTEIKWADGQAVIAESDIRWADGQPFVYLFTPFTKQIPFSLSDIIKASDSISVRKITSLEVLDVFELSDTGVVKKLSQVDVNDFLNLIDTDSIIKKTLLEVNDRLKAKDSATGIMVDDLFKAAIKLTFRGRTFLVLK